MYMQYITSSYTILLMSKEPISRIPLDINTGIKYIIELHGHYFHAETVHLSKLLSADAKVK